jgi:hypothetical protein
MSDQGPIDEKPGKDELLRRIRAGYSAIEETLSPLSDDQLARPGPEGWAIKDHLAHLAIWEQGISALLQRRPRFTAMGVQEAHDQGKSNEDYNELIYHRYAALSPAEAFDLFRSSHRELVQLIESLSEEELFKPYAAYLPEGSQGPQEPVFWWIVGNTFGHFEEHEGYIRELVAGQGGVE